VWIEGREFDLSADTTSETSEGEEGGEMKEKDGDGELYELEL
jgi:hypothetical protein